jgi:hypothetical protein
MSEQGISLESKGQDKHRPRRRAARFVASFLMVAALVLGFSTVEQTVSPGRAEAYTLHCGWPRCTLYLNKTESYNFAYGAYTPSVPSAFTVPLIILRQGLGVFARYYVNHGQCLGFQLSAIPWETQSLFPYRC